MRELQAQAAEKRMRENDKRGIQNLESVRAKQERKNEMEKMQDNQIGSNNLRVKSSFLQKKNKFFFNLIKSSLFFCILKVASRIV